MTARGNASSLFVLLVGAMPAAGLVPCAPPLTLDECDLLVSSGATDNVLRFDGASGNFVGEFVAARSGGLDAPFGLAFGPDGNLYVATGGTQPGVLRYDGEAGAFLGAFTTGVQDAVRGLVFRPDGDLYGGNGRAVFRPDGATGALIDPAFVDLGLGGFVTGPTLGPDGDLYVGSYFANEVLRFDATTGAPGGVFAGVPIAEGPVGPLVFGPDGHLYVGLFDGADVWRFDGATGASLGSFLPPRGPASRPA